MKLFKSPDPTAYAVQVGDHRYPVRGGVFAVPESKVELLPGFEEASGVPDSVIAELNELGSEYVEPIEEPAGRGVPAAAASVDLGPLHEQIQAAHDRIDELVQKLDDHGVFDQSEREAQAGEGEKEDGEKSLEERIAAVDSHDAANALAAEVGVEGFEAKKPGLDAKKKTLYAKAAELAAAQQ